MHICLSLIILYIINTNEIYLYPVYIPSSHVALQGGLLLFAMIYIYFELFAHVPFKIFFYYASIKVDR